MDLRIIDSSIDISRNYLKQKWHRFNIADSGSGNISQNYFKQKWDQLNETEKNVVTVVALIFVFLATVYVSIRRYKAQKIDLPEKTNPKPTVKLTDEVQGEISEQSVEVIEPNSNKAKRLTSPKNLISPGKENQLADKVKTNAKSAYNTLISTLKTAHAVHQVGETCKLEGLFHIHSEAILGKETFNLIRPQVLNGTGKIIWDSGEIWDGSYNRGVLNGKGKKQFPDGGWEDGDYVGGKLTGYSKKYVKDENGEGCTYEGQFKEDLMDGEGSSTLSDGRILKGIFVEGELIKLNEVILPNQNYTVDNQLEVSTLVHQKGKFDEEQKLLEGFVTFTWKQDGREQSKRYVGKFGDDFALEGSGKKYRNNILYQEGFYSKGGLISGKAKDTEGRWLVIGKKTPKPASTEIS